MHTDASMFVFWNTLYCYAQMEKVETQNFASHKERKHLFVSVFIACVYCNGLIGRRKILRLYWADAIKYIRKNQGYYTHSTKVETQNLASHKEKRHLFLSVFIAYLHCNGLIGRRKILRLYWACAVIVIDCLLLHPSYALLQSVWFPLIPM